MSVIRRVLSVFPKLVGLSNRNISFKTFNPPPPLPCFSLAHGMHIFHCPDAVGIVAKLSECIASRGGNILGANIFVPQNKQVFYSRSDFVFDLAKWPWAQMGEDFLKLSQTFNAMRCVVRVPALDPKYEIAVMASKQDHCLVDLLHGWQDGRLLVEITCVISNHHRAPNTHVIHFFEWLGIPYHYLSTTNESKREREILELIQNTNFLVLARYMQAFDVGVKLIGATSHFVTEELDEGPIIEQMVERVFHRDNL